MRRCGNSGLRPWRIRSRTSGGLTSDGIRGPRRHALLTEVHLKIDTGMNRLGTRAAAPEIAETISALRQLRVEGLLSHFASAADFTSSADGRTDSGIQQDLVGAGAARRTSGADAFRQHQCDRVSEARCVAVAGAAGSRDLRLCLARARHTLRRRFSRQTRAFVAGSDHRGKRHPAGAKVGYGGSFVAPSPMRLAVLAAGYADGVPHRLSNKGQSNRRRAASRRSWEQCRWILRRSTSRILRSCSPGDAVTLLGQEGDARSMRSRSRARRGRFPITCCAGSARG